MEAIGYQVSQYEQLAQHFRPKPGFAREWAAQAKRAGQKYMVLTTKHHEGFCLWDTKLTNYNSMHAAGVDVVETSGLVGGGEGATAAGLS